MRTSSVAQLGHAHGAPPWPRTTPTTRPLPDGPRNTTDLKMTPSADSGSPSEGLGTCETIDSSMPHHTHRMPSSLLRAAVVWMHARGSSVAGCLQLP